MFNSQREALSIEDTNWAEMDGKTLSDGISLSSHEEEEEESSSVWELSGLGVEGERMS